MQGDIPAGGRKRIGEPRQIGGAVDENETTLVSVMYATMK